VSARGPHKAAARIYRDYLQPDRLAAFGGFLVQALEAGYETLTLTAFVTLVAQGDGALPRRVLLVRLDVESGVRGAGRRR